MKASMKGVFALLLATGASKAQADLCVHCIGDGFVNTDAQIGGWATCRGANTAESWKAWETAPAAETVLATTGSCLTDGTYFSGADEIACCAPDVCATDADPNLGDKSCLCGPEAGLQFCSSDQWCTTVDSVLTCTAPPSNPADVLPQCARNSMGEKYTTDVDCRCKAGADPNVACAAGDVCDMDGACSSNGGATCAQSLSFQSMGDASCGSGKAPGNDDVATTAADPWSQAKCCVEAAPTNVCSLFFPTCHANGMIPQNKNSNNQCTTDNCDSVMAEGTYFSEDGDFGACCKKSVDNDEYSALVTCKTSNCNSDPLECVNEACPDELAAYIAKWNVGDFTGKIDAAFVVTESPEETPETTSGDDDDDDDGSPAAVMAMAAAAGLILLA